MAAPEARGLFAKAIAQSAYMISAPELRSGRYGDSPAEPVGPLAERQARRRRPRRPARRWTREALTEGAAARRLSSRSSRSTAASCRASSSKSSTAASRRGCRSSPASTAARSARCAFLAPPPPADAATYEAAIRERYGDLADAFLQLYPASNIAESMLATHARRAVRLDRRAAGAKQTALGRAVASSIISTTAIRPPTTLGLHAFHAGEIPTCSAPPTRRRRPGRKCRRRRRRRSCPTRCSTTGRASRAAACRAAAGQPAWPAYGTERAYMDFADAPRPGTHLLPGMYELNEQVVCRRRAKGGIPWNWNVGIVSPPLPAAGADADDRRRHAVVRADARQVPGPRRQMASAGRSGDGARGRPRRSHEYADLERRARSVSAGARRSWRARWRPRRDAGLEHPGACRSLVRDHGHGRGVPHAQSAAHPRTARRRWSRSPRRAC